jgi:rSAM/selenodomain-associated transferase 2
MRVSVVIPALNEAENIVPCLRSVQRQYGVHEIIVADGGSMDGTPQLAAPWARVISAPRGRARQMNAGARLTSGDVLLFLHSDSRLPADALVRLREALTDPCVAGGTFTLQFDAEHFLLRCYSFCTRFRFRWFHFGDQGIFVWRTAFQKLGGFAEMPFLEDVDFLRRLRQAGRVALASTAVTTSARRFLQNGIVRQQLLNIALVSAFLLGARPEALAKFYALHTSPAPARARSLIRVLRAPEPTEPPGV